MDQLRAAGFGDIPVVVGGIIPDEDAALLRTFGVRKIYTPKDFKLNDIIMDLVQLIDTGKVAGQ